MIINNFFFQIKTIHHKTMHFISIFLKFMCVLPISVQKIYWYKCISTISYNTWVYTLYKIVFMHNCQCVMNGILIISIYLNCWFNFNINNHHHKHTINIDMMAQILISCCCCYCFNIDMWCQFEVVSVGENVVIFFS